MTVKLSCTAFYPEFLDSYHGEIEYSACICINGLGLVSLFLRKQINAATIKGTEH